jgi:hypothetical protein
MRRRNFFATLLAPIVARWMPKPSQAKYIAEECAVGTGWTSIVPATVTADGGFFLQEPFKYNCVNNESLFDELNKVTLASLRESRADIMEAIFCPTPLGFRLSGDYGNAAYPFRLKPNQRNFKPERLPA